MKRYEYYYSPEWEGSPSQVIPAFFQIGLTAIFIFHCDTVGLFCLTTDTAFDHWHAQTGWQERNSHTLDIFIF